MAHDRHSRLRLDRPLQALEHDSRLDALARPVGKVADLIGTGRVASALRGEPLGHALHPVLTDLPIGCWTSAMLLDLAGGPSARIAARRLVAMGVLTVPATAATGLADWSKENRPSTTRLGGMHASLNAAATALFALSWVARRRAHHWSGVALSAAGLVVASAGGAVGSHMAFDLGAGVGHRSPPRSRPTGAGTDDADDDQR